MIWTLILLPALIPKLVSWVESGSNAYANSQAVKRTAEKGDLAPTTINIPVAVPVQKYPEVKAAIESGNPEAAIEAVRAHDSMVKTGLIKKCPKCGAFDVSDEIDKGNCSGCARQAAAQQKGAS